ncbi:sulfotransferase domain-containing protein [Rapidithrix thailandica]|uniref:Sulfotransferase domain-containing protein n=1 Tax=Rapidithrix thailandica TaxID=413964 RepID=A0AAW9RUN1_9BACT
MLKNRLRKTLIQIGYHTRPDFIIAGAQKAGTTGLYKILENHSQVCSALTKEVQFFNRDDLYKTLGNHYYHQQFPLPHHLQKGQLLFEATPEYLYHPEVAKRIHQYNPAIKIIIMLRDPAYRALSAWNMLHYKFKNHPEYFYLHDPRSFKEAIYSDLNTIKITNWYTNQISYVKRGIYYPQIQEYLKYFPSENILIVENTELLANLNQVLKKVTRFLNIADEKLEMQKANQGHKLSETEFEEEISCLKEFYHPYNEKLFALLNRRFDWQTPVCN